MSSVFQNQNDVDQLMLNARLRGEIEPYLDESVYAVDVGSMSTEMENQFLASMLAWEKAPVVPISQWFEPELTLPPLRSLTNAQVEEILAITICLFYEKGIVLEHSDHLSDRDLYCLIQRDILPSEEKRVVLENKKLVWQCIDPLVDQYDWLSFYASDEERHQWETEQGRPAPMRQVVPFPRAVPESYDESH